MINAVVSAAEIERLTHQIADRIAETSPLCVALIRKNCRILAESRPESPETFERIQGLRRKVYDSQDYQEGIRSFLEKRKPIFKGL